MNYKPFFLICEIWLFVCRYGAMLPYLLPVPVTRCARTQGEAEADWKPRGLQVHP